MRISIPGPASILAAFAVLFGGVCHSAQAQGATYQIVAFTGQTAPGGTTYYHFGVPKLGADGSVGFVQMDSRSEGPKTTGIYAGLPGALRLVVSNGDSVPDVSGATYSDFGDVSISSDGLVAFNAGIDSDGYVKGVWSESDGGAAILPSPDDLTITAIGSVAFRSRTVFVKGQFTPVLQGQPNASPVGALLSDASGPLRDVLAEGLSIGGRLLQTIYSPDDLSGAVGPYLDMNESGAVAMKVAVAPGASPTPSPIPAIYIGDPAKPRPVAQQGDAAPGLTGSQYLDLSSRPSIAANGLVAFTSSLNSQSGGPASAVFSGQPGSFVPLVIEDSTVPTTTNVTFGTLSDAVVNSTGDVIFRAKIWYPNESSRVGIWIKRISGPPVLIAVSGIALPTPTGLSEVTNVDFAGPGTFNDLHEFVFRADFANGDQGIYVADTRPGAPTIHISRPTKPRDYVTKAASVLVAGTAMDDTGVARVEYTVAREVSAEKKNGGKNGGKKDGKKKHRKKFIVSRVKLARGDTSWNFKVPLHMGLNLISIYAIDKLENKSAAYQVRMLRYK